MGVAPDESADVVEDVESVVRDSANDTGCSSLARFIPNPMDGLLVLAICWLDGRVDLDFSCALLVYAKKKKEGYEWQVRPDGALIYRLCWERMEAVACACVLARGDSLVPAGRLKAWWTNRVAATRR
jgi:hypothetical protein